MFSHAEFTENPRYILAPGHKKSSEHKSAFRHSIDNVAYLDAVNASVLQIAHI